MENLSKNTQKEISRRELLKALAATTGSVAAASMLPSQWVSPVLKAGVLPAHAQGSTISPTTTPTTTTATNTPTTVSPTSTPTTTTATNTPTAVSPTSTPTAVSPTATPDPQIRVATVVIRQRVAGYNFRVNGGSEMVGATDSVTLTNQKEDTQYTLEYRYIAPAPISRSEFEYSIDGNPFFRDLTALDPSKTDNSGSFALFNKYTLKFDFFSFSWSLQ